MTPTAALLVLNTGLLLGLSAIAWRGRSEPGAAVFGVLQFVSAVWAGTTALGLGLPPGPLRLRVWGLTTGLSLLVIVIWFGFILQYTGAAGRLRSRWAVMGALPLVAGAALYVFTPTWGVLVAEATQERLSAGTIVQASIGPVGGALGVYVYLVFLIGLVLVVKTVFEGSSLFVGQAVALVLGTLVTVVASALVLVGFPTEGYPLTQVALGGQSALWGYAVFRQQFLRAVPAVAQVGERAVFDHLDEGVLVCNGNGTIVRANPTARDCFDAEELVGAPIDSVLDPMSVASLSELPARFQRQGRTYQANTSTVRDWRGEPIGRAITIREVTELVHRQQRLQVLTRILRHNVRNDMTLVAGLATRLEECDDDELAALGRDITRTAEDMTTMSEKALEIETLLEGSMTVEPVDLSRLVDEVVSSLAEAHPDATVTTAVDPDELRTDRRVLTLVVTEIVENALVHAGDDPTVAVEAARTDEAIEISVTDDGPGIPRTELDPIAEGGETALKHASSLGLWVISWGTESLGGSIDIDATAAGSTVTVSIPDEPTAEAAVDSED